ncbi:hypothetical protein J6TS2_33520 [Heyndrickxia sporothermodurans]|nr:hypothetical protein J6TS2_33520 [Heyndrickxia sporothermodurans]
MKHIENLLNCRLRELDKRTKRLAFDKERLLDEVKDIDQELLNVEEEVKELKGIYVKFL